MSLEIKQTLHQITEGLLASDEQAILPIYYGHDLANSVAFNAYRFKRFAQAAGRFTTEAAYHTAHATIAVIDHVHRYGGTGYFGEA